MGIRVLLPPHKVLPTFIALNYLNIDTDYSPEKPGYTLDLIIANSCEASIISVSRRLLSNYFSFSPVRML